MTEPRDQSQEIAFERWWDRMIIGDTNAHDAELDPGLELVARRVHALDEHLPTNPTHKKQLWEELMNDAAITGTLPFTPSGGIPADLNGHREPQTRLSAATARESVRRFRWVHAGLAQFAAIALMLITLGLGYVVFDPLGNSSDRPTSIPAALVPAADEESNVAMFRGNPAHTGEMTGPGPDPALPIAERWSFLADGVVYGSPAVVDGVIYVGTLNGSFHAIDADTGEQRWIFAAGGSVFTSPAVADGIVYLGGDESHTLFALDAETGEQRWAFAAGGSVNSSPTVVDGIVYAGSNDGNVYALNAVSGEQIWAFDTGMPVESSPAVVDGVVYVGSGNYTVVTGNVFALDAASGKQIWMFAAGGPVTTAPAVVDGVVYAGSFDKNVYAIDAASGEQRWVFATTDIVTSSPAVVDGIVYVGNGTIHALKGNLYALDAATGEQRWMFATGGNIFASPVVVDGVVYIGSWDDKLYALDVANGDEHWSFVTGDAITSSVAVVDGVVYLGGEDSKVYALESGTSAGSPVAATPAS